MRLLLKIESILDKKRLRMRLNIGGVIAAFCADENISPMEINYILVGCFYIGMLACYKDAVNKDEGILFPLRCDKISYTGSQPRDW